MLDDKKLLKIETRRIKRLERLKRRKNYSNTPKKLKTFRNLLSGKVTGPKRLKLKITNYNEIQERRFDKMTFPNPLTSRDFPWFIHLICKIFIYNLG